jgi:hypothetical protein
MYQGTAAFSRSQARAILARRMNDKDRAENEILVMSCCLPDKHGHVCRLESFMFDFLKADPGRLDLATEPKHLQGVALHVWDTEDWIEIWRAPNGITKTAAISSGVSKRRAIRSLRSSTLSEFDATQAQPLRRPFARSRCAAIMSGVHGGDGGDAPQHRARLFDPWPMAPG